jgi:hypothetical protein
MGGLVRMSILLIGSMRAAGDGASPCVVTSSIGAFIDDSTIILLMIILRG